MMVVVIVAVGIVIYTVLVILHQVRITTVSVKVLSKSSHSNA